jgi:hypothetical protein
MTNTISLDSVSFYLDAWNATDPDARAEAVAAVFTEDARYVDPLADVTGHAAIAALIGAVQQQFPGSVFRPVGEPVAHHDVVRFSWGLGPEGEDPPVVGSDSVVRAADGRVSLVLGFLDKVPG